MVKPSVTNIVTPPVQAPDFLHDPLNQFLVNEVIIIVFGFVSIAATIWGVIWLYRKQRSKREISYRVISDAPIVSIDRLVKDKVEILFDGKPANDARLLVIDVWNSGNLAVKREDYDEPITFEFNDGATMLVSNVLYTSPRDLFEPQEKVTFLTKDQERVKLAEFLLNPQQLIRFAVLVENAHTEGMTVRGRIVEGNIVQFDVTKQPVVISVAFTLIITFGFLFGIVYLTTPSLVRIVAKLDEILIIPISIIVVLAACILIITSKNLRRLKNGIKLKW